MPETWMHVGCPGDNTMSKIHPGRGHYPTKGDVDYSIYIFTSLQRIQALCLLQGKPKSVGQGQVEIRYLNVMLQLIKPQATSS